MLSYMFAEVVSTAVMPQEDAREEAEYDEIRHEEATDPDSLYANNSFLQDIGSAAAGCETNSRGACAESRDNVLYSVAQLPKDQIKPTGQSQRNQSESAENDSFYDLLKYINCWILDWPESRKREMEVGRWNSWVDPPTEGHCALSVWRSSRTPWLSVSCDQKQQWICQKKALSEITEEADYVNAPEGPVDKKATRPGLRFVLPIAVCWIILLAIMGLRIYCEYLLDEFTSELSEDNAKQTAEILNLTSRIQELETRENLTVSCDNLTQTYTVSESKHLNAEIKTLTTQKDGLTKQIQEMETNWNELNKNWGYYGPNCYPINNPNPAEQLTWEEAREYCRALNADLAAAQHLIEKTHLLRVTVHSLSGTEHHALSFVEMKPLNIRGCVGERVTFTCSDWNTVFGVKSNDKYFCRSPCTEDKHIIIKAASGKTTQGNRMLILNTGNDLFVTFTNLKKSDANIYYCGVKRTGLDLYIKVNLKVTDGSIPYLIIGVILIITILMVLLKFMSKKMMKQRSKTHKPTHIVYM
ncbi:hypothetical protein F7725_017835 [Dissostichus mawsoni]|uniref:Immunoglobulin V-set domain-containing protein n=1 Tax=Dissostichus mawsoni TaxID=36200 RepID=A0A7J5XSP7_DISMA|nr:hypothetical protein F7725_017835 [Dissostichus mawsoni]